MKILFISHEASRTGAPMVLVHLLKWLRENKPNISSDILVLKGGNLESEFKKITNHYFDYEALNQSRQLNRKERVLVKLGWLKKQNLKENLLLDLSRNNYDVIYANTIVSIPFGYDLVSRTKKTKFIVHIHELNTIIKLALPNLGDYTGLIDRYITPAEIVKENLRSNWRIPKNKIDIVYPCAVVERTQTKKTATNFFTIGASGAVHWRKGHDVFLQVARYISQKYHGNNFKFVWVGKIEVNEKVIIEEDLKKMGLNDMVRFTGEVENPADYYSDFDVFLMSSREDPFPLVCIEVGMMGKPIISFDKAVGTNEVLATGGGFTVPYLSIEAMAEKVMVYYKNRVLMEKHGSFNKSAFSQFTSDLICPQLFSIIKNHSIVE